MAKQIQASAGVTAVAFLPDGMLAGSCDDAKVRVWNAASGELKREFARDRGPAGLVAPGVLATVSPQSEIKLWELASGNVLRTQAGPAKTKTRSAVVSADRRVLAVSTRLDDTSEDTVHLFGAEGKQLHSAPAGIGGVAAMALSADGALFAAASYDTDVRAWNARNGELLVRVVDLPVATFTMAFSPDGRWLAAGGADRQVHLFETKTWKVAQRLKGQNEMVATLAFSPDGRRLLTGGFNDLTVKHPVEVLLWDVAGGKVLERFAMPRRVSSVAFSPDGRQGAVATSEKTVPLLNL
jgi:WD40 repeat protein